MKKLGGKLKSFYEARLPGQTLDLKSYDPSMDGLLKFMTQTQARLEAHAQSTHTGKASKLFHKVCGKINSYQMLLQLLPADNDYVSIFAGTLNVVLQVRPTIDHVSPELTILPRLARTTTRSLRNYSRLFLTYKRR